MKKYCIVDTTNKDIVKKLEEYGYTCISTEKSADVSQPISLHADVLYLKVDNKTIYVSECQKNNIKLLKSLGYDVRTVKLSPGYKTESKLNIVVTDDMILCNPKTSIDVSEFAGDRKIVYTNQGYTKCSTVVLGNNSFITEDESIYKSLTSEGKNCLLIEKGHIRLDGYGYGFIGGASGHFEDINTILFTGDVRKHCDYLNIKEFCHNRNTVVDCINAAALSDIGGIILL